jgi:hypothetical protein
MQNRQPGNSIETGGDHVKIIVHPANIRIGIIRMQDRVFIISVTEIGYPNFGNIGTSIGGLSECFLLYRTIQ